MSPNDDLSPAQFLADIRVAAEAEDSEDLLRSQFEELRSQLGIGAASRVWWAAFGAADASET